MFSESLEKVPLAHGSHMDWPNRLMRPAGHALHVFGRVELSMKNPEGHCVQTVAPGCVVVASSPHPVHSVWLNVALKESGLQRGHSTVAVSFEARPGGHATQDRDPGVLAYQPDGHARHAVCPRLG